MAMLVREVLMIMLMAVSCYGLNCTNERVGSCYCSHQNAKFELFCPSFNSKDRVINLRVEPGVFMTMICSNGATMLDILPNLEGLEIGDTKFIKMMNCPVPADPLSNIFNTMGILNLTKIEMISFTKAQRSGDPRNKDTEFQGYHFSNLSNLMLLDLSRNGIKKIDKTFFTEVGNLKSLDLTNNRGIQIHANSFQNLGKLEELSCHTCYLRSLEVDTFASLVSLKKLSFHDNRLTRLPAGLFDKQEGLVNLNFAKNQLEELPPNIFDKMKNLMEINLSYNKFKTFPDNLFIMNKKLKKLTMLVNGDCLPFRNCGEDKIQKLVLPETMFLNSTIEEIRMLWVPIARIPEKLFKGCSSLVYLTIQNAFIKELPEKLFSDTKKIKLIDFSGNEIETLPTEIFKNLYELGSLRFIKNKLIRLDENQFFDLGNLKTVHFQENSFSDLPVKLFSQTKKLEELDLSKNKLELRRDGKFFTHGSTFDKLKKLDLSHNKLNIIPSEFTVSMLNVRLINISYNRIGDKNGVLEPDEINFIQERDLLVDLSFNHIERVALYTRNYFIHYYTKIKKPFKLNLTGNPFICDCIATELKQKLDGSLEGKFRYMFELTSKDLRCGEKNLPEMKGRLMSELEYSDLTCTFPSPFMQLNCTDNCTCSLNRKMRETIIDCSNKNMTMFPTNLILVPEESETIRLHMEHNLIRNLSKAVERYYKTSNNHYHNITGLYLSNNIIESFHQECLPPNLNELYVDHNRIKNFKQTDINFFDTLINRTNLELKLGNNLYECDCDSRALYYFVTNRWTTIRDVDQVQLHCQDKEPIVLRNTKLDDFCWNTPPAALIASLTSTNIVLLTICCVLAIFIFPLLYSRSRANEGILCRC